MRDEASLKAAMKQSVMLSLTNTNEAIQRLQTVIENAEADLLQSNADKAVYESTLRDINGHGRDQCRFCKANSVSKQTVRKGSRFCDICTRSVGTELLRCTSTYATNENATYECSQYDICSSCYMGSNGTSLETCLLKLAAGQASAFYSHREGHTLKVTLYANLPTCNDHRAGFRPGCEKCRRAAAAPRNGDCHYTVWMKRSTDHWERVNRGSKSFKYAFPKDALLTPNWYERIYQHEDNVMPPAFKFSLAQGILSDSGKDPSVKPRM